MWMDGFDYYTDLLKFYDEAWSAYYNGSWYTGAPTIGAWGRCGTPGVKFVHVEEGFRKSGFSNEADWVIAMAMRCCASTRHYLFVLEDVDGNGVKSYAFIDAAGYLRVCTGRPDQEGAETQVAASARPVAAMNGAWHHFECRIRVSSDAGIIKVQREGDASNPVIDATGLNTLGAGGNAYANAIVIGSEKWQAAMWGQDTEHYMDDLVIRPGATTLFGDARIITRMPTKAGTYAEFTPSAAPNWECVNENPPNESDFVSSSTVGHRDTYGHDPTPLNTQSVLAIGVNHYTQKADAGMRKVAALLDIDGVLNVGADVIPSLGSYQNFKEVWEGPYTKEQADSSEFGVKISG